MPSDVRKNILTRELVFTLRLFAVSMLVFSTFRFLFLLVYLDEFSGVPAGEIFRSFLHGLRFDAAVNSMGFVAVLVLSFLPFVNRLRVFRWFWIILGHLVFVVFFLLQVADLQYFEHAHKRLGYEAFAYLDANILPVLSTSLIERPLFLILTVVFVIGFVIIARLNIRQLKITEYKPVPLKSYLLVLLALIPVLIILARGGVQRVPLRTADSFISRFNAANVLTINSPHLAFRSLGKSKRVKLVDSETARERGRDLLRIDPARQVDAAYPLLVAPKYDAGDGVRHYNVVVILMESWTGKFVGPNGDTLGVTPHFNELARQGLFFDRFFASGFRSTSGLFSTLTGIPDQIGIPVMRRPELMDNFGSLSCLLKKQGYTNIFVHGGLLDFDNLENMLVHEKFDVIVGKNELKGCGGPERTWGYDDEFAFRRANLEFAAVTDRPFFGMIFTVTNHSPYLVPNEDFNLFTEQDHPEYKFLNAYYYSDWALGQFFKEARNEAYFENTIFVITADHTHHTSLDVYENQHIPMLLYAPGLVEPGVSSVIGSQVDIPATIGSLLRLPVQACMGRDLLSLEPEDGFAVCITGHQLCWIEDEYFALMGLDSKPPRVYDYRKSDYATDVAVTDTALAGRIRRDANALYQLSADLLNANKIIPDEYISVIDRP
ncbi:MAG: sulfatase-like hydrolase/transferase [bacterium]|nr:sulfatase-like hydrolase/transferase [bacterium]